MDDRTFRRLVPDAPFPPYAYVPRSGRPHPTSDPAGHSFGKRHALPPALEPDRWRESPAYLYGIDLFNARFYWEAHEAWETLWHAAGRRGVVADHLKALIKMAAAGVKFEEGVPPGTATHARRAAELWRGLARGMGDENAFLGFAFADVIRLAEGVASGGWPVGEVLLIPK